MAWEALSQGDPQPGVGGLAQDQGSDAEAAGELGWAGPAGWVGWVGWESEGSNEGLQGPPFHPQSFTVMVLGHQ